MRGTLTSKGRITLPKAIRDKLGLDEDAGPSARIEAWLGTLPTAAGQIHLGDVVLAKACWTLSSIYQQPKAELLRALRGLLGEPMFGFDDRGAVEAAVAAFEDANCGFSDCLIVACHRASGCNATVTFDKQMQRLEGVSLL